MPMVSINHGAGSQAQESYLIYSVSVILITVIKVNMTDERAMDDVRLNAATHMCRTYEYCNSNNNSASFEGLPQQSARRISGIHVSLGEEERVGRWLVFTMQVFTYINRAQHAIPCKKRMLKLNQCRTRKHKYF